MNVWLALLLTMLSWACTFHVGKFVVTIMSPADAVIWRFLIAALFMIPLVTLRERWNWRAMRRNAVALLVLGGFGITGFQLGMFYGLQSSSAINAALITALSPALTVLLVSLVELRVMGALHWLGLALGLAGVLEVVSGGSWAALRSLSVGHGDLWLLFAAVTWAVYSVVLRRFVRGMSVLQISTITIVVCALLMMIGTALIAPSELRLPPGSAWLSLLFMGVVGSGLSYLWWNLAVLKIGAARAVSFLNLVPVFTAAIGVALGEIISLAEILGAVLVIGGVALATANSDAGQKKQAA